MDVTLLRDINKLWKECIEQFSITGVTFSLVYTGESAATFSEVASVAGVKTVPAKITSAVQRLIKKNKAKPLRDLSGNIIKDAFRTIDTARDRAKQLTIVAYAKNAPVLSFEYTAATWQLTNIIDPETNIFSETQKEFWHHFEERLTVILENGGLYKSLFPTRIIEVTYSA